MAQPCNKVMLDTVYISEQLFVRACQMSGSLFVIQGKLCNSLSLVSVSQRFQKCFVLLGVSIKDDVTSSFGFVMLVAQQFQQTHRDQYYFFHWPFPPQLTTSVEMEQWFVHCSLGEGEEPDQEEEGTCFVLSGCNIQAWT